MSDRQLLVTGIPQLQPSDQDLNWWQTDRWLALAALLAAVPLIWPALPPFTDMPGHIGRYRIVAESGIGPLSNHYAVHRALIGNLGVDLLVAVLHPFLDVEPATRFVVLFIPVLTVAALLWLSREAHGRISPAAMFALPLAYAFPLQLGFVNFCASVALAIGGLALWIRLEKRSPDWVRIVLFIPFAGAVWICHSFGWAMLGLVLLGAEWVIRRQRGRTIWRSLVGAALACLPMAWPQVLSMLIGSKLVGDTGDWFDLQFKAQSVASMLRERWKAYDVACVIVIALFLWAAVRHRRLCFAPIIEVPALLCLAAFLFLPRLYAGGAYVDMRVLPYAAALGLVAVRTRGDEPGLDRVLALSGAAFFVLRLVTSTVALALFASGQEAELRAVPFIPVGASVLTLVKEPISSSWDNPRLTHIAGIAIARRQIFTNEQWAIVGQQLIKPKHPAAAPFDRDPSQLIEPRNTMQQVIDFGQAISTFNRGVFGYVWTIGFPPGRARAADLVPVWSSDRSALYRVERRTEGGRHPAAESP